jgi:hypothetical protein
VCVKSQKFGTATQQPENQSTLSIPINIAMGRSFGSLSQKKA